MRKLEEDSDFAAEAHANAWSTIGDPSTDSLLLEIEGGWVRGRPSVHDAIERAVRGAVADSLRDSWETRSRRHARTFPACQESVIA